MGNLATISRRTIWIRYDQFVKINSLLSCYPCFLCQSIWHTYYLCNETILFKIVLHTIHIYNFCFYSIFIPVHSTFANYLTRTVWKVVPVACVWPIPSNLAVTFDLPLLWFFWHKRKTILHFDRVNKYHISKFVSKCTRKRIARETKWHGNGRTDRLIN